MKPRKLRATYAPRWIVPLESNVAHAVDDGANLPTVTACGLRLDGLSYRALISASAAKAEGIQYCGTCLIRIQT